MNSKKGGMSKIEKRLSILAILFVAVYLGAAVLTIHSRWSAPDREVRIASEELSPAEGRLMLVELFLPMMIVLALAVSFILVRRKSARKLRRMEDEPAKTEE